MSVGEEYSHLTQRFTPGTYLDSSLPFLTSSECLERIHSENGEMVLYQESNSSDGVIQTVDMFQRLVQWVMRHTIDDPYCRDFFCHDQISNDFG